MKASSGKIASGIRTGFDQGDLFRVGADGTHLANRRWLNKPV